MKFIIKFSGFKNDETFIDIRYTFSKYLKEKKKKKLIKHFYFKPKYKS